jgi:demethylmenaquinone methyltransferase/2-methoxy-6-polyprenyl-1,4-benzoquinol methylase
VSEENRRKFSKIAKTYDKVNRIISLGMDVEWRRRAALECFSGSKSIVALDAATGTADLALSLTHIAKEKGIDARVVGLDHAQGMLREAKIKLQKLGVKNITLVRGDALKTGFKAGSFDAITTGFALRSFDDLEKFMKESYRVLKPGGRISFLDVARPGTCLDPLFKIYYSTFIQVVGALYSRHAYSWLTDSSWKFSKEKAAQLARKAGFRNVRIAALSSGAAYILTGTKPKC